MRHFSIFKLRYNTLLLLITLPILFGLFSTSCVSNKQAVYVQPGEVTKPDFEAYATIERIIKPGDELFIRVKSDDEETNIFSTRNDEYFARTDVNLISYTVNEQGFIRFPVIGNIKLIGLTLDIAANAIERTLVGILSNPSVYVKFINKNVTVLGEVLRPGRYEFVDEQINIFQALGYAGDVSYYGNRKKIMLVREQDDLISKHYIDLTDESLIESYYFYIMPNDVIYVEPLKRRAWGFQNFPFGLLLSVLSTTVIVLTYMQLYGNN